jgi:hypothetical protein
LRGEVSVTTDELTSIVEPEPERDVANDFDETLWEESETSLRHLGRPTVDYLVLITLGGAVVPRRGPHRRLGSACRGAQAGIRASPDA